MGQEEEEEMTSKESWEETVFRVQQIVQPDGGILYRNGQIFIFREEEEKYRPAISEAVMNDDLPKFLSITKDNDWKIDMGVLLTYCLYRRAKKCAMALLSDETIALYKHQRDLVSDDHVNLAAQYFCDPEILLGILEHGSMKAYICRQHGLLPIHFALTNLRDLKHVAHWTHGDSIIKLIILLCLPDSKNILDCVRLLAERMKGVEDLAFYCVMDRGLIELAALLIVAREKVMAPMSRDLEQIPDDWYSFTVDYDSYRKRAAAVAELKLDGRYVYDELPIGHTIVHRLLLELGLIAGEGIALQKNAQTDPESYRLCEETRQVLWDAYQLILIFKRAGEALGAYVRSDKSSLSTEQIIKEVAVLLMEAGYKLTYKDIDLKNAFSSLDVELIWEQLESMDVNQSTEETPKIEDWISLPAGFAMPDGSLSNVYHNRKLLLKESSSFTENNQPCGMTFGAFDLRRKKSRRSCIARSANCFLNTKEAPVKKSLTVMQQPGVRVTSTKQMQWLVSSPKNGVTHRV